LSRLDTIEQGDHSFWPYSTTRVVEIMSISEIGISPLRKRDIQDFVKEPFA
jgi:hypothetical protein